MQNQNRLDPDMCLLGCGVCIPDDDYAQSLGFSDCGIDVSILAPMLRRRTSKVTRMAITALVRACADAKVDPDLPVIFVSSVGEMTVTDQLCQAIAASQFPLSPTLFHNSVHNSAAGYWSISIASMQPMQSMAALEDSFAMGLLEAYCQLTNGTDSLLLVSYDEVIPQKLVNGIQWQPCALALVLSIEKQAGIRLSRPYPSQPDPGIAFPTVSPTLVALSLLKSMQKNTTGMQRSQIANGESSWFVNWEKRAQ